MDMMDIRQAIKMLDDAVATLEIPRANHSNLMLAIKIVTDFVENNSLNANQEDQESAE